MIALLWKAFVSCICFIILFVLIVEFVVNYTDAIQYEIKLTTLSSSASETEFSASEATIRTVLRKKTPNYNTTVSPPPSLQYYEGMFLFS